MQRATELLWQTAEVRRLADEGRSARQILDLGMSPRFASSYLRPRIPGEIPYLNTPDAKAQYANWLRRYGVVAESLERVGLHWSSTYHSAMNGNTGIEEAERVADKAARNLAAEIDNPEGRLQAAEAAVARAQVHDIELDVRELLGEGEAEQVRARATPSPATT